MNYDHNRSISAQEAKGYMDKGEDYVLLDVRSRTEYDEGHIPGALLLPHTELCARAGDELPDKAMRILVYCRSGKRSHIAAEELAELGYRHVYDFGGILSWPYDIRS